MALFPGDMNIGWGFGYAPHSPEELEALDNLVHEESQPTDPLLAVSELEERVIALEERLRSLTIVVNRHGEIIEDLEG